MSERSCSFGRAIPIVRRSYGDDDVIGGTGEWVVSTISSARIRRRRLYWSIVAARCGSMRVSCATSVSVDRSSSSLRSAGCGGTSGRI
ncbi:MAG: hypothetical protein UX83_C0011G0055 [Candidatus Wolfebacteria bacterium GW2011_GWE2_47_12]|nr:MAG: hypothetical protein UX83_C0011G0055 [Candidatus Wolfebacteria bacterium GW2011_GWE2_47_12]KKU65416.1 MAG: hypothetical protein UX90_C0006G0020 [Candidatus Wolfebacteria bacterium GW2011_GWD2_47_17]